MNKVVLIGRLTRNPEIRWSQADEPTCIARFTLAVDRNQRKQDERQQADFISCVSFGKRAEWCEKYLQKGTKIALSGRIQTGSYTNRDGVKIYTTDVVADEVEFAESKNSSSGSGRTDRAEPNEPEYDEAFTALVEEYEDGELPF